MKLLKALVLTLAISLPAISFAASTKVKMDANQAIQDLLSNLTVGDSSDDNCTYGYNYDAKAGELTVSIQQDNNELSVKLSTSDTGTFTYVEKDKDGYGTRTYITPSKSEVTIFQAEDMYEGLIIKKLDNLGRAQQLKCTVYF